MRVSLRPLLLTGTLLACRPGTATPAVEEAARSTPVQRFWIAGTEPFWAVRIDSVGIRFSTPDDTAGLRFPPIVPTVRGDTLHWNATTERDTIDIALWPAACSDGMSDREWAYAAALHVAGRSYQGCARQ